MSELLTFHESVKQDRKGHQAINQTNHENLTALGNFLTFLT